MKKDSSKKRRIKLDLGMVIFLCVLIYIVAWNIIYMSKEKITYYEVTPGEMVNSDRFNGMLLFDDSVITSSANGDIYYIAQSGSKVGVSSPVYCIDKSNNLKDILSQGSDVQVLEEKDLDSFYFNLEDLADNYNNNKFSDVYDFKALSDSIIVEALSSSVIDSYIDSNELEIIKSSMPGYVYYYEDGLEGVTKEDFTDEMLSKDNYVSISLNKGGGISSSNSAYKLITSEIWHVVFKLEEYQYDKYIEGEYVQTKFLSDNQIVWGQIDIIERNDNRYCAIEFTNSLVRYANNRYADIEVIFSSEEGLKVPNSAIVVREFFTIPKDYCEAYGDTLILNLHSVDKDGNPVINEKELDIYDETEDYYMVSTKDISEGSNVIQNVSGNIYTVSNKIPVTGVYNINRGYAKFNEVSILAQNDDFAIIRPNDKYGLIEYDHIVLNGNSVEAEEIIYQE